jgi:hypothetical protein
MGRRSWATLLVLIVGSAGVACGGRTLEETLPGEGTGGASSATMGSAGTGGRGGTGGLGTRGSTGATGSPDYFNGLTDLPPCNLGTPLSQSAGDCPWYFTGRCYDTKIDACACACPNRSGTSCISGFPDADGKVVVVCN